jgi:hypothetical protein
MPLPLLALCYLNAPMDRVNISFAAELMHRALHFSLKVYGLGSGLFFVTYTLREIPLNCMLLRFGARLCGGVGGAVSSAVARECLHGAVAAARAAAQDDGDGGQRVG